MHNFSCGNGYSGRTAAKTWWQEKRALDPAISKKVRFSGAGLMRALWVCTEVSLDIAKPSL